MIETKAGLHCAPTKQRNPATLPENGATIAATLAQPGSLKALARLALSRNQGRNPGATLPEKPRNFDTEKTPERLREVAAENGAGTDCGEGVLLLVAPLPLQPSESETAGLTVVCYTPLGEEITVQARDPAHAERLRLWNPPPAVNAEASP